MSEIDELGARVAALEGQVEALKARNARVEQDKAWEVSRFRIGLIAVGTFAVTALIFWSIGVPHYLRNAVVPCVAYFLSTQSLPYVKRWWLEPRR